MKVLMVTSEWPTSNHPEWVPFLVREVDQVRKQGVDIDVFPFRGRRHPVNYFNAWWQIRQRLQTQPYDLIHAQFGQSALPVLFANHCPLVITYRGSDLNGFVGRNNKITFSGHMLRRLSQLVALRADEIILVSEQLARYLPCKNYHVIPSGIDLELFRPMDQKEARQRLLLPMDRRLILFAGGTTNPIKRFPLAQAAVEKLASFDRVELLAPVNVPPHQMPLYMNAADVLLLTSAHEGSPNVVKEALACNLPVVAVDVGDVRQRLKGVAGCCVCEDDHSDTITSALCQVLQQQEPIDSRSAVVNLDGKLIAQRIVDVYKKAMFIPA